MTNSHRRCTYCKKNKPVQVMIIVPVGAFCCDNHRYLYGIESTEKLLRKSRAITKKKHAEERRVFNANDRKKRLSAAQKAFNAYIRARDNGKACISCPRTILEIEKNDGWKPGGCWDCGHFITVGAKPELRFNELNAHRQCKSCNAGSGKYSKKNDTVSKQYRVKLIDRIGLNEVEVLEGPHDPQKYTCEDLKKIELYFKGKLKELQNS